MLCCTIIVCNYYASIKITVYVQIEMGQGYHDVVLLISSCKTYWEFLDFNPYSQSLKHRTAETK